MKFKYFEKNKTYKRAVKMILCLLMVFSVILPSGISGLGSTVYANEKKTDELNSQNNQNDKSNLEGSDDEGVDKGISNDNSDKEEPIEKDDEENINVFNDRALIPPLNSLKTNFQSLDTTIRAGSVYKFLDDGSYYTSNPNWADGDFYISWIYKGGVVVGVAVLQYHAYTTLARVEIPSEINGLPVLAIGALHYTNDLHNGLPPQDFLGDSLGRVKELVIPSSVKYAIDFSVRGSSIEKLVCNSDTVVFEPFAFASNKLTSINFPNGISQISDYMFVNNQLSNSDIFKNSSLAFGNDINIRIGMGAFAFNNFSGHLDFKIADKNPGMKIVTDKGKDKWDRQFGVDSLSFSFIDAGDNYGIFEGNKFTSAKLYNVENLGPKAFFDVPLQSLESNKINNIHTGAFAKKYTAKAPGLAEEVMTVNVGSVSTIYDAAFHKSGIDTASIQQLMDNNTLTIEYSVEPAYSSESYAYKGIGAFSECWNATGKIVIKNINPTPELFRQCNFSQIIIQSIRGDRPNTISVGERMFQDNQKYTGGAITKLDLSGLVTSSSDNFIYTQMFEKSSIEMDTLVVPSGITHIGDKAFATDGNRRKQFEDPRKYYSHLTIHNLLFGNPQTGDASRLKNIGKYSFSSDCSTTMPLGELAEASPYFNVKSIGSVSSTFPDTLETIGDSWDCVSSGASTYTRTVNSEVIYPASLKNLGGQQYVQSEVKKIDFLHSGNQGLETIGFQVFKADWSKDVVEIPVKSNLNESTGNATLEIAKSTSISHLKLKVVDGNELTFLEEFVFLDNTFKSFDVPVKSTAVINAYTERKHVDGVLASVNGKFYFDIGEFAPYVEMERVILPTEISCRFLNDDRTTEIIEYDSEPLYDTYYIYQAETGANAFQQVKVNLFLKKEKIEVLYEAGSYAEFDSLGSNARSKLEVVGIDEKVAKPTIYFDELRYQFEGWYTTPDFTPGTKFDFNANRINDATILYAKLVDNVSNVAFHAGTRGEFDALNSGVTQKTISVYPNNKATVPELFYDLSKYTFDGWFTSQQFLESQRFDVENEIITGDLSLYAKYKNNVRFIVREGGEFVSEGSGEREISLPVNDNEYAVAPVLHYNSSLYRMEGWYTTPDFTPGTEFDFANTQIIDATILYAKLVDNVSNVAFHAGIRGEFDSLGSGVTQKTVGVYPNHTATVPELFYDLSKYTFDGWFTSQQFLESQRFDVENEVITGDLSLYAKYKNNVRFIVRERGEFVSEGSGEREIILPVNDNEYAVAPVLHYDHTKYTFGGWYTSPECLESQKFNETATAITDGITLYAKLTESPPDSSIVDADSVNPLWAVQIPREIKFRETSSIFNADIKLFNLTGHEESTQGNFDVYTRSSNGMTMKLTDDNRYKLNYEVSVGDVSIGTAQGTNQTLLTTLTNAEKEKRFSAKIVSQMSKVGNYSDMLTFVVERRN